REIELSKILEKLGATVKLFGFEKYRSTDDGIGQSIISEKKLHKALSRCDVLITPLSGINAAGEISAPYALQKLVIDEQLINTFTNVKLLFSGTVAPVFKKKLSGKVQIIETGDLDQIAFLNAVPTAEGAIAYAICNSDITIHGSESFVLGFGRCGSVLARSLQGLSARVSVFTRSSKSQAAAKAYGTNSFPLNALLKEIHKADYIFNTVPSVVLTADLLAKAKKNCLLIDLASFPGGIDFLAAQQLGLKGKRLPGIPGKIAPKSAGRILGDVYPSLIINKLKGGENK
ncbi:MAG: dipicolinate synthase subunit DpsA, partial [Dethiobacteria bacterium]